MPEPTLTSIAVQAAVKAVAGSAVTASTPAVRKLLKKVRRDPAIVKRFTAWREVQIDQNQMNKISDFLESREGQGLLEMLSFTEYSRSEYWEDEQAKLRQAFYAELSGRLTLADDVLRKLLGDLWTLIHDSIRLEVANLRGGGGISSSSSFYVASLLNSRLFPDERMLQRAVDSRSTISTRQADVLSARKVTSEARNETRKIYETLQMPHSRENFRVPIGQLYVHRNLRPTYTNSRISELAAVGDADGVPDHQIHNVERRVVILGNPGAGKSTYVRYLTYWLSAADARNNSSVPFLVELKTYGKNSDSVIDMICRRLSKMLHRDIEAKIIGNILTLGLATVIFDGIDEVGDLLERREAAQSIEGFSRRFPLVRILVTARREGYVSAPLDRDLFATYILPDFNNAQIHTYIYRWFGLVSALGELDSKERSAAFLRESAHLEDLRSNPLMLSLLCLLYEYEGWIPENRLQVYEECANLLFVRWDRVRRVELRETTLSSREVWFLFQEIAYWFFVARRTDVPPTESSIKKVIEQYVVRQSEGMRDERVSIEAVEFLNFCAGRAWLLSQVGSTSRGEKLFDFTHRTFMEYFAACYITRQSEDLEDAAQRVWTVIREGKSYVVAQIVIQQCELHRHDGLNRILERLVEIGAKEAGLLYKFLLDLLHYVKPGAQTIKHILLEAIRHITIRRDNSTATELARIPIAVAPVLQSVCHEQIVDGNNVDESLENGAIIGGIGLLVASKIPLGIGENLYLWQSDGSLSPGYLTELRKIGASHPFVIYQLHKQEIISLSRYAEALGRHALTELSFTNRMGEPSTRCLLYETLIESASRRRSDKIVWILDQIASFPDSLIPMSHMVAKKLLAIMGNPDGQRRVLEIYSGVESGGRKSFEVGLGYPVLLLAVSCAAFEIDEDWLAPLSAFPAISPPPRSNISRVSLGANIFMLGNSLRINTRWRVLLSEWQHSKTSFIR
ncbi:MULTISPECIES: NACHT domain-containing protein [unclassified Amycolatopsis]|uniref:NACHT domain-containing protein n=1 Tax=unclassified Amycolatopsis TaxID=2618356 RepID=UPI002875BF4C|nr:MULTISPECIES: NACHT domain-containing protein [unclassified Amycolatopsis]MDS0137780.1 NACHT domain-containing protein [Amycolatopsis sp. 505]MDS0141974.1 NACHT domain-containing protein [Amycolatopsis sp. CM201R]